MNKKTRRLLLRRTQYSRVRSSRWIRPAREVAPPTGRRRQQRRGKFGVDRRRGHEALDDLLCLLDRVRVARVTDVGREADSTRLGRETSRRVTNYSINNNNNDKCLVLRLIEITVAVHIRHSIRVRTKKQEMKFGNILGEDSAPVQEHYSAQKKQLQHEVRMLPMITSRRRTLFLIAGGNTAAFPHRYLRE